MSDYLEGLFDSAGFEAAPRMPVETIPVIPDGYVSEIVPFDPAKAHFTIDKQRAEETLSTLLDAYTSVSAPYDLDRVRVPQDPRHMPPSLERGSVDHAMFFWNVCYYMRGGIKSVDAVKRLANVYEQRPDLFSCEQAVDVDPDEFAKVLTVNGLGFQNTVTKIWRENAKRMTERWDGDPRNIFDGVSDYETCQERIQNNQKGGGFMGFKEKMTSMIAYYLMDEELIDPFVFPIPIDLHIMRISIANGFIDFPDAPNGMNLYNSETTAALRKLYYDFAVEHEVNPLRLCDALWLFGEALCGKYPGNITLEPLGRKQRNGRSTVLIPQEVDITNPAQQKAYADSCGICPIESTCETAIPGKPYYVGGVILKRGQRVRFPPDAQASLFDETIA
jgi:hypothetical protein